MCLSLHQRIFNLGFSGFLQDSVSPSAALNHLSKSLFLPHHGTSMSYFLSLLPFLHSKARVWIRIILYLDLWGLFSEIKIMTGMKLSKVTKVNKSRVQIQSSA